MISMHLLYGVLLALAALVGAAIALSAVIWAAARPASKPGQPPHGGIRRDVPQLPEPEPDDARELVLL
jgi:hypothetical protein